MFSTIGAGTTGHLHAKKGFFYILQHIQTKQVVDLNVKITEVLGENLKQKPL